MVGAESRRGCGQRDAVSAAAPGPEARIALVPTVLILQHDCHTLPQVRIRERGTGH